MPEAKADYRQRAVIALQQGDLEQAVELLGQAIVVDENDAASLAVLGVIYHQRGHHDGAIRALTRATRLDADNDEYHFQLGLAHEAVGQVEQAAAAYTQCVEINPRRRQARQRLNAVTAAHKRALLEQPTAGELMEAELQQKLDDGAPGVFAPLLHHFGEKPGTAEPEPLRGWTGNIHDTGWNIFDYPGHTYGHDPDTGKPNRILDATGYKVADITPEGAIHDAQVWHRD